MTKRGNHRSEEGTTATKYGPSQVKRGDEGGGGMNGM